MQSKQTPVYFRTHRLNQPSGQDPERPDSRFLCWTENKLHTCMCLLTCFLLNTPYHEEQAWQPFAEITLISEALAVLCCSHSWIPLVCEQWHLSVTLDTSSPHMPGVKPSTYLMKKASQTLRLLLHDLQFKSVPKLLRSLGSADLTLNYRPRYKQYKMYSSFM